MSKWHRRFLGLASEVSRWSKDPSSKVGAYLVGPDREPISHGYNGFPRGVPDSEERYSDREFKLAHILHAEKNALLNALRTGARTVGATLYCTHPPCTQCASAIIQAGVTRVISYEPTSAFLSRWDLNATVAYFDEAGIEFFMLKRTFDPMV